MAQQFASHCHNQSTNCLVHTLTNCAHMIGRHKKNIFKWPLSLHLSNSAFFSKVLLFLMEANMVSFFCHPDTQAWICAASSASRFCSSAFFLASNSSAFFANLCAKLMAWSGEAAARQRHSTRIPPGRMGLFSASNHQGNTDAGHFRGLIWLITWY